DKTGSDDFARHIDLPRARDAVDLADGGNAVGTNGDIDAPSRAAGAVDHIPAAQDPLGHSSPRYRRLRPFAVTLGRGPQFTGPASDEEVRFRARYTRRAIPPRTRWQNRACSHPHSVALSARSCRRTLPPNRRRRIGQTRLGLLPPESGSHKEPGAMRR